ncbi:MAG: sulfite exporter TauE/SafE family protein [bacterium]
MTAEFTLLTAFLAGLLGSAHCFGMCGGISSALAIGIPVENPISRQWLIVLYNTGRILSYSIAGAVAGTTGLLLGDITQNTSGSIDLFRMTTGIILLLIAFYLLFNWQLIEKLSSYGLLIWKRVSPIVSKMLPIKSPGQALLIGLLWGLMPCGLVYAILLTAWVSGGPFNGAITMLAFGLGTLPSMIGMGIASGTVMSRISKQTFRKIAGISILIFGLWTLSGPTLIHVLHLPIPEWLVGCHTQ